MINDSSLLLYIIIHNPVYTAYNALNMTMLEIVWILTLSVCDTKGCVSQTIDQFPTQELCLVQQWEHEAMPVDPNPRWSRIEYKCGVKNGLGV